MTAFRKYLILSYNFPPDSSIGSRRWAKFSKYLIQAGHEVRVITSVTKSLHSPWDQDVKGISIIRLKNSYPTVLDTVPKSLFKRLHYRLSAMRLRLITKGTIYDRAVLWKQPVLAELEKQLNQYQADIIIANGPPHSLLYYLALFKKQHPEIRCYGDLRDPWTWWYNMGYGQLSGERKKHEENLEKTVIETLDRIFVPDQAMQSYLQQKYAVHQAKIELLPHGFDAADFAPITKTISSKPNKQIKLVMAGSMYIDLGDEMESLNNWILAQRGQISLCIYTADGNYGELFKKNPYVEYRQPVASDVFYKNVSVEFDFFVLIYPDRFKDYFATKFYEVCAARLPFLYIGKAGKTASFIQAKNLGIWLDSDQLSQAISSLSTKISEHTFKPELDFLNEFNFEVLTQKLI